MVVHLTRLKYDYNTGCAYSFSLPLSLSLHFPLAILSAFAFVRYKLPKYRPVLFAHFFSGRRRQDDLQMCLDALGMQAISIDIIYHAEAGDLCNPDTFDRFKKAIEQGIVCGFLVGPPCETWSRARGKQLSSGETGPRIVRSNESPFGRRCLTLQEDVQVSFGSRLLGVTMRLFCVALVNGATAIVEHPAPNEERPDEVAIWRTALIRTPLRCSQGAHSKGSFKATLALGQQNPQVFCWQTAMNLLSRFF